MPIKPVRAGAQKAQEYKLVSDYKLTYRNREDVTNLPPGVLIVGSQNVLSNVSERLQIRKGYALDGAVSTVIAAIRSSFDWLTRNNGESHLRAGFLTSALNDGKLQYRYVDPGTGAVTWTDLITGLTSVEFNFTTFWNTVEVLREVLFVNGSSKITAWNGAVTILLSAAATTITKTGTGTWAQSGFYAADYSLGDSTTQFDITNPSGTTYRYTWDTTGTDPLITKYSVPVGSRVYIAAQNFTAANNGLYTVTASDTNYFEVTNAAGVAENDKTIGTGWIDAPAKEVVIGAITYGYHGGETTTTLTGVFPDPSGNLPGVVIQQAVRVINNSGMNGIPSTFQNGLISVLNNQIFLGALDSSTYYISRVDSYTDYTFSSPRQAGEGWNRTLDANLVAFKPQEQYMYVSAGQDLWYNINFSLQTSTVGVTYEQVNALPLKTGRRQGAISQAFVSHMKNDIIVVTNETTIDEFGRIAESLATPQTTNISDSIKLDVDRYDFTDGSIAYHRYKIYVAVPKEGLVLIYNLATNSWEAPQTLPISRFYIVDGELYGHSYSTSESYELFTGYADRVYSGFSGFPIDCKMVFSYQNYGTRSTRKSATGMYVEGYINANTTLNMTITYEIDGCSTVKTFSLEGSDTRFVCIPSSNASLGKTSLGKQKLGGSITQSINGLPPKFRIEKTFNNTDFFECSVSFEVLGVDNRLELLAFGLNATHSSQEPVSIRD